MVNEVQLNINGNKLPLNDFMKKILVRAVMAIVGELKGINEDEVKNVELAFSLE